MSEETPRRYAERLFPAPVDHGVARPDRAVSTVDRGTDAVTYNDPSGRWYEGGGQVGERAVASIVVYPPTGDLVT